MVFVEVFSVFREEERVDAAPGSGGREGLLLLCGIIQAEADIVLGPSSRYKYIQDLVQPVQAQEGKIKGKCLMVVQVSELGIPGHQIVKMGGAGAPQTQDKKGRMIIQIYVADLFRKQNSLQMESGNEELAEKADPAGSESIRNIDLVFLFQLFPDCWQYCVELVFPDF